MAKSIASRIAIVGAGLAGVTCARTLHHAGLSVVLFEQHGRVGGRMCQRQEALGQPDDGAQFFTARSAAFKALVAEAIVVGAAAEWQPRVVDVAADQALERRPLDERWFVGSPRMSGLVDFMARGIPLQLDTTVVGLQVNAAGVTLQSREQGELGPFEQVVVATAAERARPLIAGDPDLQAPLAAVNTDPCFTLLLHFDQPLRCDFDVVRAQGPVLSFCGRDSSKPNRPVSTEETWVVHAQAAWSRQHADADRAQVHTIMLEHFSAIVGSLPRCEQTLSYFAHAKTRVTTGRPYLMGDGRRISVTGDYMLGARVEAAFESGLALACALLEPEQRA